MHVTNVRNNLVYSLTWIISCLIDSSKDKWEDNPHAEWDARAMAVHAAMIDRMDQGIGQVIDALEKTGQL